MKKLCLCIVLFANCSFLLAQSYKKLHDKAIVVDTHNDIASKAIEKHVKFDSDLRGQTHTDLNRLFEGGIDVQVFSIFCDGEQLQPYAFANREIDSVHEWVRRNPEKMMLAKTPGQLKQAVKEKKLAAMIGVEGGHMIEDKLENLDALYERGARYLTLTWNNSPTWATSAKDETEKGDSLPHKGLTDFGKRVVRRMNELGMLVDVSHVGEQTFWDVIHTTTKPVIASHSNVWKLCPNRRNLKDDQIKAIGKNGGVIQLNFYAGFLDSNYERKEKEFMARHQREIDELVQQKMQRDYALMQVVEKYKNEVLPFVPSISVLLDHVDYIVKLIGVDHVGFGSDFDGIQAPPLELHGVEDYPLITKALMERGYSTHDIKKMLGGNFIRVFEAAQLP
jgi:membrane dipeptidase